jgi:hypothetical protein
MSARMSKAQWEKIRQKWEDDPRDGYVWIISEESLSVSRQAMAKRAKDEGWAKAMSLKSIVERAQKKADGPPAARTERKKPKKKVDEKVDEVASSTFSAAECNESSIDLRSAVIKTHRDEWKEHRAVFDLDTMADAETGLNMSRQAKTAAEVIKIRQEGERKAWGLDAVETDVTAGVKTTEQLDAIFAEKIRESNEMQERLRREREAYFGKKPDWQENQEDES